MATHSSTLAWKIPWMEEPGGGLFLVNSFSHCRKPFEKNCWDISMITMQFLYVALGLGRM